MFTLLAEVWNLLVFKNVLSTLGRSLDPFYRGKTAVCLFANTTIVWKPWLWLESSRAVGLKTEMEIWAFIEILELLHGFLWGEVWCGMCPLICSRVPHCRFGVLTCECLVFRIRVFVQHRWGLIVWQMVTHMVSLEEWCRHSWDYECHADSGCGLIWYLRTGEFEEAHWV